MTTPHSRIRSYTACDLFAEETTLADHTLFVLCPEDVASSEVVAACRPAVTLQSLGGLSHISSSSTRGTFEYAVRIAGVRRVVVCGHAGCDALSALTAAFTQCRRMELDSVIGALVRAHRVLMRALWFDTSDELYHVCDQNECQTLWREAGNLAPVTSPSSSTSS